MSNAAQSKRRYRAKKKRKRLDANRNRIAPPSFVTSPRFEPLSDGPLEKLARNKLRLTDILSVKTMVGELNKHIIVARYYKRVSQSSSNSRYRVGFPIRVWFMRVLLSNRCDGTGLSWCNWLRVKQTDLACARLGLFADTDFKKGQMIGLYLGSTKANSDTSVYAVESSRWGLVDPKRSFDHPDNPMCYMGMHLMNDPTSHIPSGAAGCPKAASRVNTVIYDDLSVHATRNITKGEELYVKRGDAR